MNISTLLRYLVGNRQAVLQIASCKQAVWLGLLLVLSAGFAREYDGEDLLSEPWHLLIPVWASLGTSFLLFTLVVGGLAMRNEKDAPFWRLYRPFLSLYWMTAPLAWLYAIPVERFLSAGDATLANLWLLGLVSLWRVCLMTRAISVLFKMNFWAALMPVMLFADTLAVLLIEMTPLPIFSIMGGLRLSESERIIAETAFTVTVLGVLTWPIWCLGTIAVLVSYGKSWEPAALDQPRQPRVSPALWALALAAVFGWVPVLPATQAEQQLRSRVERDLKQGRIAEALATMSAHQPSDFPPHWDPPPRLGYGEREPPLIDIMEAVVADPPASWVRQVFVDKFRDDLNLRGALSTWRDSDRERFERYLTVLEQLPEGPAIIAEQRSNLARLLDLYQDSLPEAVRERIEALLEPEAP